MIKPWVLILICLWTFNHSFAQNYAPTKELKRPRVGLVLSGGGAKGFAHIGAIKLLEEVGIVPDYITGTSMGSIVGALYAMGYTVEEMHQISDTTDWTNVLSNTVSLREVTVSEKAYYGTFLTELNVSKSGVYLPGGLIEGQNLLETLSALTQPVHGISSFLDFPIPFTCVATDIVNGVPVAINQGDITTAIRASMAIPTAFTPVEYDTLLLIDGGWTRNLPVQEAIDMGADIIISVDVGAPLKTKEELQSMISILDQTAWLLSVQDTRKQLEMSDYVIRPKVGGFSTFDFGSADTIIAKGYAEALKQKAVFEALAHKIYPTGRNTKRIEKPNTDTTFTISKITVSGCKLTSPKFVMGRLNSLKRKTTTMKQVEKEIGLLYGSMYYEKVAFELRPNVDATQTLYVKVVEDNPAKLKLSFYYDTENSLGLNLNLTLRNLLMPNSRLIFDSFISENPILGLKYLKYMGVDQKGFVYLDVVATKDSRFTGSNIFGQPSEFNYQEFMGNVGLAYTSNNSWLFSVEAGLLAAKVTPTSNPDSLVKEVQQSQMPIRAFINSNTLDKAVFPTKGRKVHASASYSFDITQKATLQPRVTSISVDDLNEGLKVDPYFVFQFTVQQFVPIHPKVSLYADAKLDFASTTNIGFNDFVKVGGVAPILKTGAPFWGLSRSELGLSQMASFSVGFQWNIAGELYFKGKLNYLNSKYPMKFFTNNEGSPIHFDEINDPYKFELNGKYLEEMFGYGGELAYNSPIGPIRTLVHYSPQTSTAHFFLGIGYNIFKSRGDF
ncbi:MAG: NTE family protein [Salibacteraceae bacterium]|jgi:NTE family protein